MLRIMEYCPEMADSLLSTIIDRAIQIDVSATRNVCSLFAHMGSKVEIQVELEELEMGQEQTEVFDLDPFDTIVGQESSHEPGEYEDDDDDDGSEDGVDNFSDLSTEAGSLDNDDPPLVHTPLDLDRITEMVNKLDAILKLLFDHFDRPPSSTSTSTSPSEPSTPAPSPTPPTPPPPLPPAADPIPQLAQFHALLAIFTRTILCTFKSRYTQFLIFWFASRDTTFADLFLGELVAHALLEPTASEVSRAAAASYVASFVSRAMFIGREEARGAVRVLCRFLEHQVDVLEGGGGGGGGDDAVPPGVFYAVSQAVFLIFCFRWRELVEGIDDGEQDSKRMWMVELSIVQRVVACPLQPLKVLTALWFPFLCVPLTRFL
jgi:RNA polymerase I-specific transcription initiation factor RRN3